MLILGIHGGEKFPAEDDSDYAHGHDAGAALIRDGNILAAVEEERFNRIKHTNCFPESSIRFCLETNQVSLEEVDVIVRSSNETHLTSYLQHMGLADGYSSVIMDAKSATASLFSKFINVDIAEKLRFCDHHDAHTWSAFGPSNFENALVVSIDGYGDGISGSVSVGDQFGIRKLRDLGATQSLGNLYNNLIRLIGFGDFEEFKAMGLAPYGDPSRFKPHFDRGRRLLESGDYEIDSMAQWEQRFRALGWIVKARRRGAELTQEHADIAASVQQLLEEIVFHVLSYFQRSSGLRSLCLAGGVALNCTLNGKLLNSGFFDEIFVQPAANDSGLALGAALWAHHQGKLKRDVERRAGMIVQSNYFGTKTPDSDSLRNSLAKWDGHIAFEQSTDICRDASDLIMKGAVIGWIQGCSEFGPRALGNRSILADPRPAKNKDRINQMVKKREQFRPFAPSIVEEAVEEFFDLSPCRTNLGHMTFSLKVKEEKRELLGAVTHADGSARLQVVSQPSNPLYWQLLHEFGLRTGIPLLLNTSFNNDVEPIVETLDDALCCYLTTGLDFLVIGSYVIRRGIHKRSPSHFLDWQVSLPPYVRLVRSASQDCVTCRLESTKWIAFRRASRAISTQTFEGLSLCAPTTTVGNILMRDSCTSPDALFDQLWDLWDRRLIQMRPKPGLGATRQDHHSSSSTI